MRLSDENIREGRHLTLEERIALQAEEIKQLWQENEQLVDETIKLMKENAKNSNKKDELVKVLKQARKALHKGISELKVHCKYFDQTPEEDACIEMHEAVVEIDKAIGGKEDV